MAWGEWINTVQCMDCLEGMKQMPDGCVDLVVTDPPFNVGRDYGLDFDDKKDSEIYWDWIRQLAKEMFRVLVDSSRLYIFHTDGGIFKLRPILELEGFVYGQTLVWYGPNLVGGHGVIKGDWHYMHEPFLLMRKGKRTPMLSTWDSNAFSVQVYVRPQSNFKEGRWHPAQKPLKLIKSIIARTPGDTILDPFMGSGTTAVACKQLGRNFIGFEINPKYVEICNQRLAQEVLGLT